MNEFYMFAIAIGKGHRESFMHTPPPPKKGKKEKKKKKKKEKHTHTK